MKRNPRPWRAALLAVLMALAGCDPNPGGPSAPATGADTAPAKPDPKAAKKGAVRLRVAD